jgi:hypothetical protein
MADERGSWTLSKEPARQMKQRPQTEQAGITDADSQQFKDMQEH